MAQSVERRTRNAQVAGSIPAVSFSQKPSKIKGFSDCKGKEKDTEKCLFCVFGIYLAFTETIDRHLKADYQGLKLLFCPVPHMHEHRYLVWCWCYYVLVVQIRS